MPAPLPPVPVAAAHAPAPPPGRATAGWRERLLPRLDTLRVKLFLAIAGANVVLVGAAYLVHAWSFDQGLVDYLNRADEARLTPLVAQLAEGHEREGHWRWVSEDRQRWLLLLRDAGVPARAPRPAPPASGAAAPLPAPAITAETAPEAEPFSTIHPRLLLLDAQRQVLIGPPERAAQAVLKPIENAGGVVGYLAYVPRLQMAASLERVFLAQQNQRLIAIVLGLVAAVVLTAALITRWLGGRLAQLGAGTAALTRGEYGTRLPIHGHDELARLGADFNRLAQTLEDGQRARQQWIADIAHELRTPLATLRAEIEALQDGVRPLTQEHLGSLAQEVGQLTRLVEDLRLLSLSDLGALHCQMEPLDLAELIHECLAPHAEGSRAPPALQLQLDLQPLRVHADGERLAQVLANLLQNTLRYSDAPARLQLRLRRVGSEAHLVWEDSPPGVRAQDLPRLTERLFRADASRARASGGSGLGLAIVMAIVTAHGGRLQPSASTLGGLRWDIWLPLAGAAAENTPARSERLPPGKPR